MKWFGICLKFRAVADDRAHNDLVEYSVRIYRAAAEDNARAAALADGALRPFESYENPSGATVTWVFEGLVGGVSELPQSFPSAGQEIFGLLDID